MENKLILLGVVIIIIFGATFESGSAQKQPPKKAVQKEQPKTGGTLVVGLGKEPSNPNPFINTASTTQFVREASYESLLTRDNDGRIVPNLAEAFNISTGGTELTLRLRKGVKFQNGKEMKADDVLWSANHVKDPKNGALGQKLISDAKSFEKVDDYTIKFILSSPSVTFLSYLADIRMLPIVPENSLQTGQIKLEKNTFIPGTGPFILEQFQPGFDTVLRKFTEYWGTPAYLDKIIFRPITDGANRFNALRTGDIQMADRLSPLDAARVLKGEIKGIKILEDPLGGYQHLIVNYLNPLFQKIAMRQALLYATDKKRLIAEVFFGAAQTTELMIDPQGIWAKAANLPSHKRNLGKVNAVLKAAGYNGQELVIIGRTSSAQLMESYQRMLGEAGIKVKVEMLEAGVMIDRRIEGKYDLHIDGGAIDPDPVVTMMPKYYTTKTEKGRYSNSKTDQLLINLNKEFNEKKRLKIFKELAWTIHNDVADVPLLFEVRYTGMSEKIQDFGPPKGHSYTESGNFFKNAWIK